MIKKGDKFHIKHEPKGKDVWAMSGPHKCEFVKNGLVWYLNEGMASRKIEDCVKIEE